MKEARFYTKKENEEVQCYLCRRMCKIKEGETGYCHVRKNIKGTLYSLAYGKAVAINVDPIEKKPFYHFMPGSECFSFSTVGCNYRCLNCQNWEISQAYSGIIGEDWSPEKINKYCKSNNVPGIAYTYTEPTVFMEYALDTAKLAHQQNKFNVFVSNGYMSDSAISEMKGLIDASRIDLKGFKDSVYKDVCGNVELEGVLAGIKGLSKIGHIEIINLIIPGYNDDDDDIRALANWVKELDPNIPLHFTGFYPSNKMMDVPPTELDTLVHAREIAIDEGINFAYTGNRANWETESTYCPECGKLIVKRMGFNVLENKIEGYNRCPYCGKEIYIVTNLKEYWKRNGKKD